MTEPDGPGCISELLLDLMAEPSQGSLSGWTNMSALDFLQVMHARLMTFESDRRDGGTESDDGWSAFRHALLGGPARPRVQSAEATPTARAAAAAAGPVTFSSGADHGEPSEARSAVGRWLTKEDRISDLIVLLSGLDPSPLLSVLELSAKDLRVTREEQVTVVVAGRSRRGRADLVLRDGDRLLAVVEVKAAAGPHGDQLAVYQAWRDTLDRSASLYLLAVAGDTPGVSAAWRTEVTLPVLMRAWQGSAHPHASWLGGLAGGVLADWAAQFEGQVGLAEHPVVADLVAKQIAVDLGANHGLGIAGLWIDATRTVGGTASVVAWLPYPGPAATADDWLCVDLRSPRRDRPDLPWLLRLGVEVTKAELGIGAARARAHDLAALARPHLTRSAFVTSLRKAGRQDLASAILAAAGTSDLDGLRGVAEDAGLQRWRDTAAADDEPGDHPVMYSDWGRRLASQVHVDVTRLDRHGLRDLVAHALDHLATSVPPPSL